MSPTLPTAEMMPIDQQPHDSAQELRWDSAGRAALAVAAIYAALAVPLVDRLAQTELATACVSLALAAVLIGLSAFDMVHHRLPDRATLPLIVGGIAFAGLTASGETAWHMVWHGLAAVIGFASLGLISWGYAAWRGRPGLGLGDAKLFAAAGAWLGVDALSSVLLIAAAAALVVVALASVKGKAMRAGSRLPFGPFIALGFWAVWLFGPIGVAA